MVEIRQSMKAHSATQPGREARPPLSAHMKELSVRNQGARRSQPRRPRSVEKMASFPPVRDEALQTRRFRMSAHPIARQAEKVPGVVTPRQCWKVLRRRVPICTLLIRTKALKVREREAA